MYRRSIVLLAVILSGALFTAATPRTFAQAPTTHYGSASGLLFNATTFANVDASVTYYTGIGYYGWFYVNGTFNGQYVSESLAFAGTPSLGLDPSKNPALIVTANITFNGHPSTLTVTMSSASGGGAVSWSIKSGGQTMWASNNNGTT